MFFRAKGNSSLEQNCIASAVPHKATHKTFKAVIVFSILEKI
jgi:hypothetical protein